MFIDEKRGDQRRNLKLFDGDTLSYVVRCPYLVVYIQIVSHKFSPSPYFTHKHDRKSIHSRVNELRSEGLGYRKIHKVLVEEKWKIGKSPTCVDTMIRKMEKREEFLNQETRVKIDNVEVILVEG